MQQASFERSLRTFARRKPFKPFTVDLTSGSRLIIEHPEALAFYNGLAVYLATEGEVMLFDHHTVARLSAVASMGTAPSPSVSNS